MHTYFRLWPVSVAGIENLMNQWDIPVTFPGIFPMAMKAVRKR